jgi:Ni/Co efflux regulator RcnB
MMKIKYLLMVIIFAFMATPATLAQHSEKYKNCAKACRATRERASAECQKKPAAEQQACKNAAKNAVTKCKRTCTE